MVVPQGLGPVRDNMGLFHIVSSKLLPDAEFYQQCLRHAFAALLGQARSEA